MSHTYRINGLDENRIVTIPLLKNEAMRAIISKTSVGLFPNRCESGTNLVLMEYMACGKPGIVSDFSGHRDIATEQNLILLKQLSECSVRESDGRAAKLWMEAPLEEIVEALEYAYQNREALKKLGTQAAKDMQRFSWNSCALRLLNLLSCKPKSKSQDSNEETYRRGLAESPHDPKILRQLGDLLLQNERCDEAVGFLRKAAVLAAPNTIQLSNLALALLRSGRPQEAAFCYEELLSQSPGNPELLNALGIAQQQAGELDAAVGSFMKSLSIKRDSPETLFKLANTVLAQGKAADALSFYEMALRINPACHEALCNRGNALRSLARPEEAIASYREALRLKPELAEAQINMGCAMHESGRFDEALNCFESLIASCPECLPAYVNLGNLRGELGEPLRALESYRKAIAINPSAPDPHLFAGSTLLMLGNFAEGWREYEWRLQRPELAPLRVNLPRWTKNAPPGVSVLVLSEQGFGDTINFVRYLPLLRARCARVIFRCQAPLAPLLENAPGIDELQIRGRDDSGNAADFQIPLLSLPFEFQTDENSIPEKVPYLEANPMLCQEWQKKLAALERGKLKVGLCWGGSATNNNDKNRSIPTEVLSPLLDSDAASFFSLRKGAAPFEDARCTDWTADLKNFADTAALISNLDLLISVDTAVAHLAGALGKPVWLMLPLIPTWRWQLHRTDSPWYPTMRIFRQGSRNDWQGVLCLIAQELKRISAELKPPC